MTEARTEATARSDIRAAPLPALADDTDDAWLDELESRPDNVRTRTVKDTFSEPLRWLRRVCDFTTTTPGQLIAMMIVLSLSLFAAGWSMSQSMALRQQSLDVLVNSTEPMSNSAHVLYTSLSQADTVSATGFVSAGAVPEEDVDLYRASLDRAVVAANEVLEGTVDTGSDREDIRALVTQIQRDIPIYAGVMERAKTNQRMGNPVGTGYMSEASGIMRERLLDNASQLFKLTRDQVTAEMARLSSPQWIPLSGLVAALVFLLAAQWYLWRVFRRRLNKGFLVATALMLVSISWVGAANYAAWRSGVMGFERASTPWEQLTTARIDAQEARTNEIFALLRRQPADTETSTFSATYSAVSSALDAAEENSDPYLIQSGRTALGRWSHSHAELVTALDEGSFDSAIDILTSTDPGHDSTARSYAQLDSVFNELVQQSRADKREYVNASLDATRAVSGTVLALSIGSIAAIWLGIRRRLGEYL